MPAKSPWTATLRLQTGTPVKLLIGFWFVAGLFGQDYDMLLKGAT